MNPPDGNRAGTVFPRPRNNPEALPPPGCLRGPGALESPGGLLLCKRQARDYRACISLMAKVEPAPWQTRHDSTTPALGTVPLPRAA